MLTFRRILVVWANYVLHSIRNTFNFQGRASRLEFTGFVFFGVLLSSFLMGTLTKFTVSFDIPGYIPRTSAQARGFFIDLYLLWVLIVGHSISIRRLHDIDYSGWWLIGIDAVVGSVCCGSILWAGNQSATSAAGDLVSFFIFLPLFFFYQFLILLGMVVGSSKGKNRFGREEKYIS